MGFNSGFKRLKCHHITLRYNLLSIIKRDSISNMAKKKVYFNTFNVFHIQYCILFLPWMCFALYSSTNIAVNSIDYIWNVESSWNVMAHGDAQEGKWRGNWQMEWVANTLHTTSERGVSSITTGDVHTSAASSRLNWRTRRFKWTRPFCRKTKSGFCACAITFQMQSAYWCAETTDCTLHWSELSYTVVKGHYLLVLDVIMKSRV